MVFLNKLYLILYKIFYLYIIYQRRIQKIWIERILSDLDPFFYMLAPKYLIDIVK